MRYFLSLILFVSMTSTVIAAEEKYFIEQMKDNVYRFTAGHHKSVFMVTSEGIFVTDPINKEAANWLHETLKKRFKLPIKYLAYSHNHTDHVLGGDIFSKQGATVIAHEFAAEDLRWTKADTAMPDVTFTDELTIQMAESEVLLRYHGPNNGRGSVSMLFQPANVLFVVDWIVIGRMPYQDLPGYDIHGMIHSTREILASTHFDLFIGGHAETGNRKDVEQYLSYIEALYNTVRDGMLAGKTLEQLQTEIQLNEYRHLPKYDEWLTLNVAGVYRNLMNQSYFHLR